MSSSTVSARCPDCFCCVSVSLPGLYAVSLRTAWLSACSLSVAVVGSSVPDQSSLLMSAR